MSHTALTSADEGPVSRPEGGIRLGGGVVAAAHAAALCASLAPLLLADVPALVDYPNHLARMHILASLETEPALQAIYEAEWAVVPNLAMDALVPLAARLIGVVAAGKLFIAAALVLNLAGIAALHRAVHGRVGLWPLAGHLVLFNFVLAFGFLNYLFGVGLALLALAGWIGGRTWPWPGRLVLGAAGASVLYLCHLGAFAVFALCAAAYEAGAWYRGRPRTPARLLARLAPVGGLCLPAVVIYFAASPTASGAPDLAYEVNAKLLAPLVPVLFYGRVLDLALLTGLVLMLGLALRRRGLGFAPELAWPAGALGAAVVLVPTWAFDTWGNDFRLAVPLVFVLIAAGRPVLDRRTARLIALAGTVLLAARVASVASDWAHYDRLYSELRESAHRLEPGARVLPAVTDWSRVGEVAPSAYRRTFYHVPALLALERPVFVPTLFTVPGRRPLVVKPPYAALDTPHGKPVGVDRLRQAVDPESAAAPRRGGERGENVQAYAGWPANFDYVLMLDFGAPGNPLPQLLVPAARGSYFTLYAIAREDYAGLARRRPAQGPAERRRYSL